MPLTQIVKIKETSWVITGTPLPKEDSTQMFQPKDQTSRSGTLSQQLCYIHAVSPLCAPESFFLIHLTRAQSHESLLMLGKH